MRRLILAALLAHFSALPARAGPAMPIVVITDEVLELNPRQRAQARANCRALDANRRQNMRAAAQHDRDAAEIIRLAQQYESDAYGCPDDPQFALNLLLAALPDPVPDDGDFFLLEAVAYRLNQRPGQVSAQRLADIRRQYWLQANRFTATVFSDAETQDLLSDESNMQAATQAFGRNDARDLAMLRLLSDPANRLFDRDRFAELVLRAIGRYPPLPSDDRLLDAAGYMLDPRFGPPDFPAARRLMSRSGYSPFYHGTPARDQWAAALWQRIGEGLLASPLAEERDFAAALLATGDPLALERRPNPQLPADPLVLDAWPAPLPAPVDWNRIVARIGDNYPARAIRQEETGPVHSAAHYTADGQFAGFVITRSSGSIVLDERVIENWGRYYRPRPAPSLPPDTTQSRDVLITMPVVEFHLTDGIPADGTRQADGRIIVTASVIRTADFDVVTY